VIPVAEWGDELVEESHERVEEAHSDGEGAEQHEVVPVTLQLHDVVTEQQLGPELAFTIAAAAASTRQIEVVFLLLTIVLQLGGLGGRCRRGVSEEGCGQNQRQDAHEQLGEHEVWHPSHAVLAVVIDII
jgi:hypothetical protein